MMTSNTVCLNALTGLTAQPGSTLRSVEPWCALLAAILSAAPRLPGPVACAEHPKWFVEPGNTELAVECCRRCAALPDCQRHYRRLKPTDPPPWPGSVVAGVVAASAKPKPTTTAAPAPVPPGSMKRRFRSPSAAEAQARAERCAASRARRAARRVAHG
jgi:hypothetical protein